MFPLWWDIASKYVIAFFILFLGWIKIKGPSNAPSEHKVLDLHRGACNCRH